MKYQNLKAFEKHLASAAPHHLCRCYLLQIPDDSLREQIFQTLFQYLLAPGASPVRMSGSEGNMRDLFDALQSPSLFGGEAIALLDACEKLSKKQAETLADFLDRQSFSGALLLGASGKTPLAKTVEKFGVVLDLSEEKPWDKEKRIAESLAERAKSAGKRLSFDIAPLLFERLGVDAVLLDQEIDKLICFTGDRASIERADVFRISSASRTYTLWQMAEEMIWAEGQTADAGSFYGLIPSLRSQLQLGLKISSLIEERVPEDAWGSHLPKIWPKTLEKRKEQAARKGTSFFKKGLDLLFKIELLSRTGSNQPEALFDLFRAGLHAKW